MGVFDEALWALAWSDGRLTVFFASAERRLANDYAKQRRGCKADGWPSKGCRRISLQPVESLELGVTSRRTKNAPKSGRLRIDDREICWLGPGTWSAERSFARRGAAERSPVQPVRRPVPTRLWSCIHLWSELVIFNAPNFGEACCWAERELHVDDATDDCERVECVEVQLAPNGEGYAPYCYRVWIDGYKVGWPEEGLPQQQPPFTPIPAEARLPIPRYEKTVAVAPPWPPPLKVYED